MKYIKQEIVEKLGKEYCNTVEEVLSIRENRREIYGDSFIFSSSHNLFVMVEEKLNRYKLALKKIDEDDLIDVINYLIFYIIKKRISDEKEKNM